MTILTNTLTVEDGGLGIAAAGQRPVAVVGCCSTGTAATPVTVDTIDGITSTFGHGPLCEDAAAILSIAGGSVLCVRAAEGTAAVLGGLAQSGAGSAAHGTLSPGGGNTSTAVFALTGTSDSVYPVKIKVTLGGANLAASPKIQISLDGGVTYLAEQVAAAGPTAIGTTGLSLGITDGTFVLTDTFGAVGAACATTGAVSGTAEPAISGTPLDAFDVRIQVTGAAANLAANAATIKVSIDGGNSYGAVVALPVSGVYVIPDTGLTITFADGTFVVGDVFRFKTAAPAWSTTTLNDALTSLAPHAGDYEFAHVAGDVDATSAGTLKTWAAAREAAGEYTFAVCGARDQITGESITTRNAALGGATPGFSGFDGKKYLDVCASCGYVRSYLRSGVFFRRNLAVLLSARLARSAVYEHPGKVRNGPIVGLMPDPDGGSSLLHNVATYTSLDGYRFSGAQNVMGQARGRYFFTSRTMALATSDFSEIQRIRVMAVASKAALAQLSTYVGDDLETKTDGSGTLEEATAQAIDGEIAAAVRLAVVRAPNNFATAASARAIRTNNVLTTGELKAAITVVPKGSIVAVTSTISYSLTAGA